MSDGHVTLFHSALYIPAFKDSQLHGANHLNQMSLWEQRRTTVN